MPRFPKELHDARAAVRFRHDVLPTLVRRVDYDGGPQWLQAYGLPQFAPGGWEQSRAQAFGAILRGDTGTVNPEHPIPDYLMLPAILPPPGGWGIVGCGVTMQLARAQLTAVRRAGYASIITGDTSALASSRRKATKALKTLLPYVPLADEAVRLSSRGWLQILNDSDLYEMPAGPTLSRIGKW